ncbi:MULTISPECIES: hypothetical protein [unclassified Mycoplasma]|uniref:hypothetical protein n=1 Tax=unclassified Mycoplasma TaxID=2683645 RepID=UPI00211C5CFB|nr:MULTISPECIES: hypothetical protein [unclassified Mycoplasma]UUM19687.1 hypothetical protein NPA11_02865 [Mycoplasma sp. 1578d]UUM24670.1 hypothetical protein NPA12_03160 [Mycoplasma sp. 3686d]
MGISELIFWKFGIEKERKKRAELIEIEKQKIIDQYEKQRKDIKKWITIYFQILNEFLSSHENFKMDHFIPYSELNIQEYIKTKNPKIPNFYNTNGDSVYKYHRHHVDEIFLTKNDLISSNLYNYGPSIIVTYQEHCLLHYLIVMAQLAKPNNGMLHVTCDFKNWDAIVQKMCNKLHIEYVEGWDKYLVSSGDVN